jgi:hypothetical protein
VEDTRMLDEKQLLEKSLVDYKKITDMLAVPTASTPLPEDRVWRLPKPETQPPAALKRGSDEAAIQQPAEYVPNEILSGSTKATGRK